MNEQIFRKLFEKDMSFQSCRNVIWEKDRICFEATVEESDCNPYGVAHGGYLYSLCDNAAGLLGAQLGFYVVTQQASISYIKAAAVREKLSVIAVCIHDGRSSKVAEVSVSNRKNELLCRAVFTLFPFKKIEE